VYAAEADAYAAYRQQQHALAQALYAEVPGYAGRMGEAAAAYRRALDLVGNEPERLFLTRCLESAERTDR